MPTKLLIGEKSGRGAANPSFPQPGRPAGRAERAPSAGLDHHSCDPRWAAGPGYQPGRPHDPVATLRAQNGSGGCQLDSEWLGSLFVLHLIAKLLRAGALLGAQRACVVKRTMVGTSVAVVLSGASVVMPVAQAGADQVSTTKDQVTALEAKAEAGAAQVHRFTMAYEQANLAVSNSRASR